MPWKWTSKLSSISGTIRSFRSSRSIDAVAAAKIQRPPAKIFTCTVLSMPSEQPTDRPISLRNLLYYSIIAAERGGDEVRAVQESGNLKVRSKSICFNPVTLGDMRSHLAMKGSLKHEFPSLCIISEEDNHCLNDVTVDLLQLPDEAPKAFMDSLEDEFVPMSDVTVWIDPLDGTQEFTEGMYESVTTMVGIAVRGKPVVGVIHQPFLGGRTGRTSWGWTGHGASLPLNNNGAFCRRSDVPKLVMSKDPFRAGKVREITRRAFGGECVELLPLGGAGYKLMQVASGNCDGYIHLTENIKKWDTCAGHAILNTLQGNLTTLCGRDIDYSKPISAKNGTAIGSAFLGTLKNHNKFLTKFQQAL